MARSPRDGGGTSRSNTPRTLSATVESLDPVKRARLLERIRQAVLTGAAAPAAPRDVISESWQRSLEAHIDPERSRPRHIFAADEIPDVRETHLMAPMLPLLRRTLLDVVGEAAHMMIVTDLSGNILWREGNASVIRRADNFELVEGVSWSEDSIGTNAMGTALSSGRAVQIHSAEHLVARYHSWTCAAAPIHDPDTGKVVAAIDLTGPLQTFHPSTLGLVSAVAELVEADLRARLAEKDDQMLDRNVAHIRSLRGARGALLAPSGRVILSQSMGRLPERLAFSADDERVDLGDGREGTIEPLVDGWLLRPTSPASPMKRLSLNFLGARLPIAHVDGHPVSLTVRHAEVLTILALNPDGLTAGALSQALYGDTGNTVTVRAEIYRLRHAIGSALIDSMPYRLNARVEADFLEIRRALRDRRLPSPAVLRRGPLLPLADAPAVRDERHYLTVALRSAVLRRGDVEALWALIDRDPTTVDPEMSNRLRRLLPDDDPRLDELPS